MAAIHLPAIATSAVAGVMALGALRALLAMRRLYPPPLATHPDQLAAGTWAAPRHDDRRLTAAVLLDHAGTEISDFLLPFELLAASGEVNVYATAPESRPATLTGGLDVMPHLSYADFGRLPIGHADLIVVPYMPRPDAAVLDWMRSQATAGATMLSICTGAEVVAAAGVLDGRSATAHWGDIARLERRYEDVRWVRGMRFVDDGDVVASAGITSGIDATLHIIRRLCGASAMQRAADVVGYTDLRYLDDPTAEQLRVQPADAVAVLKAAFGRRPEIGVLLRNGVDETALAAAMDTYGATLTSRLRTVSRGARPVRTRHGLTLLPRASADANGSSRLLAPYAGDEESDPPDATALPQAGAPYDALSGALDDLADRAGMTIARFAAKRLEHRTNRTVTANPEA